MADTTQPLTESAEAGTRKRKQRQRDNGPLPHATAAEDVPKTNTPNYLIITHEVY